MGPSLRPRLDAYRQRRRPGKAEPEREPRRLRDGPGPGPHQLSRGRREKARGIPRGHSRDQHQPACIKARPSGVAQGYDCRPRGR